MMSDTQYFVAESDEAKVFCQRWCKRYFAGKKAAFALAKSLGAKGIFPGFNDELVALTVVDPVPDGWRVVKRRGGSRMEPKIGKAGQAARDAIDSLPKMPTSEEVRKFIKHPCQVSYKTPNGDCGFSHVGRFMNPVGIVGPYDGVYVIYTPDAEPTITSIREEHPDAAIEGAWEPPPGLKRITEAEYELLKAQARVRAERDNSEAA